MDIEKEFGQAKKIAISGHIRPDGDAVGSCLGMKEYLLQINPDAQVDVFLTEIPEKFLFLKGADALLNGQDRAGTIYDIFLALDSSDPDRLGEALPLFRGAKRTVCIDHHISNLCYADLNIVVPDASSTCEVLIDCMKDACITREAAEALYLGLVHDSGVFRHSSTSPHTMEAAARMMRKGINFSAIVNDTYYDKTYLQNQILGRALLESILLMDRKVIYTTVRKKEMDFYGVTHADLDGIVEMLMGTAGTEVAIFLSELEPQVYKVSMRSRKQVDVSQVATYFGGGGHVRAAGCTMQGSVYDVINNLTARIEQQMITPEQDTE